MMTLLSVAALAAAQPATPANPAPADAPHAQHRQSDDKGGGCPCCKDMGAKKMACCDKHGSGKGADAGHGEHHAH